MKKTISIILILVCMLTLAMPAIAAEITTDATGSNSSNTVVTYGVSQSFIVVIPAEFEVNTDTKTAMAEIKASNVVIPYGKTLNVKISGHDYSDSWKLINTSSSDYALTYILGTTEGASNIVNNSVVLTAAAGDFWNSEASAKIYLKIMDMPKVAGYYQDTLTFTVSIDD